ncbi:exporter of polyketide antibiotics [Isoptericola hypogeus]|uniref:Exporter of polyketide antibiotics n=1 Tax=Isoptericola hypogeus TaxID=300179 RepID=A0ABN2JA98_9MICO
MTTTLERTAPAAPSASAARGGSNLAGTLRLIRFILRRDRVRLAVWTGSLVAFYAYFTYALGLMSETQGALQARAVIMETPSGVVMGGPGYGVDNYTVGAAMANEGTTWVVLALALMSIMHVVRHTRAEEESSRSELVRAAVVGRHAPAVAAVVTLLVVNAVIAVVSAVVMTGVGGADELPLADSFGMTVACALSAMVFGAVALVVCQLTEHSRGATGLSLAVFGLAFMIEVAGNLREIPGGTTLSWFSPIAWAQQARAFVDLRWWPAALSVVAIVLLLWFASVLASRRDFGGGMIASRKGRADAKASLRGPLVLAWVQQRMALMWSCIGLGLMWMATGTMLPDIGTMVGDLVGDNPTLGALFGDDPGQFESAFLGVMVLYGALCCAAYAIVMGLRPKAEETTGRAEVALSTPVARGRWFGAQLLVAGIGTVVLLAVSVYAMWVGAVSVGATDPGLDVYSEVFVSYLPAVLVYLGLTAALYAWVPRATAAGWALLAYTFVIGMFGPLVEDMPEEANWLSPFHWVPEPFVESFDATQFLWLTGAAVVLFVLAFAGFRRRDVVAS